ncbi:MAG: hypothetical protein ABT15_17740 [Pseudonocardia sp. SCN 73-27]|nr:MAG: hypothetical protein ABS80_05155 [Pseudonocardia sp. SCN 72-51]ODV05333.1 MAG: hypothetical protein ABT15_17740 [Pseudonocardia sp. SCN 73-27]
MRCCDLDGNPIDKSYDIGHRRSMDPTPQPLRSDHDEAVATFRWPTFEGPFSRAHDCSTSSPPGKDRPALQIAEEDDTRLAGTAPARCSRRPRRSGHR